PQERCLSLGAVDADVLHQSGRPQASGIAQEDAAARQGRVAQTIRPRLAPSFGLMLRSVAQQRVSKRRKSGWPDLRHLKWPISAWIRSTIGRGGPAGARVPTQVTATTSG